MDERQKETINRYTSLLQQEEIDLAQSVGRHKKHLGLAEKIWDDISNKLSISPNKSFLDIGCGFGELTLYCMKSSIDFELSLHLIDIPEVVRKIKSEMLINTPKNTVFWEGVFPDVANKKEFPTGFDLILAYSVIHYTDEPEKFIEKAVSLLNDGGHLLLGDIPNVNKKGRFLSSSFGRKFEAEYRKVDVSDLPIYENHHDFLERCNNQNKRINDNLVCITIDKYRKAGYQVYVMPQQASLPFSYTREDILISKP